MGTLYDTDIVAWASEQAELIRARKWDALDLEHIAEEIEDVGKSEKREFASRMAVLIAHLLKWKYQPGKRGRSWLKTVALQRARVLRKLKQTPSLKHDMADPDWLEEVWEDGLSLALAETGIDELPEQQEWPVSRMLSPDFLPD